MNNPDRYRVRLTVYSAVAATANAADVDATLTLDHPFVTRNDPDGYQAVKPRRELNGGRPLAPDEVAQACHRARLGDVLHHHSIASFGAISRTVTAITAAGINSPHLWRGTRGQHGRDRRRTP